MERNCSCAEVQILSAEACMFFSRKPYLGAFYSLSCLQQFTVRASVIACSTKVLLRQQNPTSRANLLIIQDRAIRNILSLNYLRKMCRRSSSHTFLSQQSR